MIDRKWLGYRLPQRAIEVERGQLLLFCRAIGETRPIYTDIKAARAAGYRGLLAPPTFAMGLDMRAGDGDLYVLLEQMGFALSRGVHGEQGFSYEAPICSGDVITFTPEVVDLYDKKGGDLQFVVTRTTGVNQLGEPVIEMRNVAVARN